MPSTGSLGRCVGVPAEGGRVGWGQGRPGAQALHRAEEGAVPQNEFPAAVLRFLQANCREVERGINGEKSGSEVAVQLHKQW